MGFSLSIKVALSILDRILWMINCPSKVVALVFLCFADTRQRQDYNESHIITAKFAPRVSEY